MDEFLLWTMLFEESRKNSNRLKKMATAISGLYDAVRTAQERNMATLDELAVSLADLDADAHAHAQWVADNMATLKTQVADLVAQVDALTAAVAANAVDAAKVDELNTLVSEIDTTVESMDDFPAA
jgi:methyl-accepting chemotaxis protein